MTAQELQRRESETVEMKRDAVVLAPAVDVCENEEGYRLRMNLPGVDMRALEVRAENRVLKIEGVTGWEPPADHTLVAEEFPPARYRRSFDLSDRISSEGIRGTMKHGVLEVTLPKSAEARTRRVEIVTG